MPRCMERDGDDQGDDPGRVRIKCCGKLVRHTLGADSPQLLAAKALNLRCPARNRSKAPSPCSRRAGSKGTARKRTAHAQVTHRTRKPLYGYRTVGSNPALSVLTPWFSRNCG